MVIFDFDGVLLDSLGEVVVTAFNSASGELCTSEEELPVEFRQLFRMNRPLCGRAGDFVSLAMSLLIGMTPQEPPYFTPDEFLAFDLIQKKSTEERTRDFFEARSKLVESNPTAWNELHTVYQPLWEEACYLADEIVLLTNKNKEAVLDTCSHFGLELDPENIYAGDDGVKKSENFLKIKERFQGEEEFYFIDDSVRNLAALEKAFPGELELALAAWGYLAPGDKELAIKCGFVVESQGDLIERIV